MTHVVAARVLIAAISAVMVAIGIASWRSERRRGDDTDGFWTAHRSLTGASLGMSLSASMLSVSWSSVYGVELLYRWGPGGTWLLAVPWLLVLGLFALTVGRLRRFAAFSQGELFAAVYGRGLRIITVVVLTLVFLAWCGAEIAAAGDLLAPLLELSPRAVMTGIALLVAAYTWAGGFRSVVATDVAQFVLIAAFFVVVGGFALGGPRGAIPAWLGRAGPAPSVIAITLLAYVPGWLAEADIWLRLTAAPDTRQARIALAVTAASSLAFVVVLPAILAARARILFPNPDALAEPVLGALLRAILPPSLAPVVLGGLAAVALSTVSTTANVVAVTLARDAVDRPQSIGFARWASAGAALAALGVAFAARSLTELFYLSSGLLAAALFWPTLGLLFSRPPRLAVRWGASVGLAAVLVAFLADRRGLLAPWTPPAVAEMGIGYIVPAIVAGGLAFALGWAFARPRGRAAAPNPLP